MDELAGYLDRWGLTRESADEIVTRTARLYPVRSGREPAVLKILSGANDEALAPRWLRAFAGRGAVRVLREDRGAVLLQRAVPGTSLAELVADGRDEEATHIIAGVMLKLHHGRKPPAGWPTIQDWAEGFTRQRARPVHRRLPQRLLDRGEGIFRDLAASQGKPYLLHGDLHHANILRDEADGWLVIDPKGVVGESAYETAASIRNPAEFYPFQLDSEFMSRRVAIFAERLGVERERILGWFIGQTVLSACWLIEDGESEESVARAARLAEAGIALQGKV
ncbi:MAG TPA: aminoglycoside phosphotransferase family protein [Bauldia sp.]|nr:aminoglycoside phosphotransferase family protein [Bauldia sp.]